MKICIVSSCGGHLTEVRCLEKIYKNYNYFFVINQKIPIPSKNEKIYFIKHSERDIKFIVNLFEAFWILWKEKPNFLLSAGAGPIVPFALISKLFFKCNIIYIESISRVSIPSLTGKIMYRLADHFLYQWEELNQYFPKGNYVGTLL